MFAMRRMIPRQSSQMTTMMAAMAHPHRYARFGGSAQMKKSLKESDSISVKMWDVQFQWDMERDTLVNAKEDEIIDGPLFKGPHSTEWRMQIIPRGQPDGRYTNAFVSLADKPDYIARIDADWSLACPSMDFVYESDENESRLFPNNRGTLEWGWPFKSVKTKELKKKTATDSTISLECKLKINACLDADDKELNPVDMRALKALNDVDSLENELGGIKNELQSVREWIFGLVKAHGDDPALANDHLDRLNAVLKKWSRGLKTLKS